MFLKNGLKYKFQTADIQLHLQSVTPGPLERGDIVRKEALFPPLTLGARRAECDRGLESSCHMDWRVDIPAELQLSLSL